MSMFFWKKKKTEQEPPENVTVPETEAVPEPVSETEAAPEPVSEIEAAPETEAVPESVSVPETEAVSESESETVPASEEHAAAAETAAEEPEAEDSEARLQPASAWESEPASAWETEPEAVSEPGYEQETDAVTEPEPVAEPEAEVSAAEPETEAASESEAGSEAESASEPEAAPESETVSEPEPAEAETVAEEPETEEPAVYLHPEASGELETAVPVPVPASELQPAAAAAVSERESALPPAPIPPVEGPDEEEIREKRHRSSAPFWILILLMIIGGCYYYGMTYSQTHFLENTYINGIEVSNMTAPQVERILSKEAEGYEVRLKFRDGEEEVISGTQIGYKVKPDGSVDSILRSQDHRKWFMCFFRRTDGRVEQKMTYDPDRLQKAVAALPELQEDRMIKPKDAYIELHDTTFAIIPEVEGNQINVDLVQKAADEAVRNDETEVDVAAIKGSYGEPKVRAKDQEIVDKCESYNKMIAGSITWELPNGEELTVDANTTKDWLSVDDEGNYYRDEDEWEENISFWVDELARNVNTVGKDWSFHATGVGDIEVSGGDYGYSVDKVTEREEVWDLLWDGETDEREPYFYTTQYTRGSGIGGTYIEANLSQQHVYIYIDGERVCESDCVSGNISNGHGTPTGVYQILYKDTDVDLKGQQLANGQYSYISHVDYWMPFYGGCGFHDASWRSSFGGSIYKYDGSHGCINLPPSILPTFYSYVEKGMPVVVFY